MLSGYYSSGYNDTESRAWYDSLRKPIGQPPPWVFPVVWPVLYTTMGYAAHKLCAALISAPFVTQSDATRTRLSMILYLAQLGLNIGWSPLFFKTRNPPLALYDVAALTSTVAGVVGLWWTLDRGAAWLMMPYLAWTGYATWLNYKIVSLNYAAKGV